MENKCAALERWSGNPPTTAAEEAWLRDQIELVRSLLADEEPSYAAVAPAGAPIVFLDMDDVVCLSNPCGGRDARDAIMGTYVNPERLYRELFHAAAVAVLHQMHVLLDGHVRYVISSTWRELLTRAQLRHVLREAGMGFVADSMEDLARWATPVLARPNRRREIGLWLERHHRGEPFVVIDDVWSGASLLSGHADPVRIVLCKQAVGLLPRHLSELVPALRTPKGDLESW